MSGDEIWRRNNDGPVAGISVVAVVVTVVAAEF